MIKTSSERPIPVAKVVRVGATRRNGIRTVTIECPLCGKEHRHGYGNGNGNRVSHCTDRSVGEGGYFIEGLS